MFQGKGEGEPGNEANILPYLQGLFWRRGEGDWAREGVSPLGIGFPLALGTWFLSKIPMTSVCWLAWLFTFTSCTNLSTQECTPKHLEDLTAPENYKQPCKQNAHCGMEKYQHNIFFMCVVGNEPDSVHFLWE